MHSDSTVHFLNTLQENREKTVCIQRTKKNDLFPFWNVELKTGIWQTFVLSLSFPLFIFFLFSFSSKAIKLENTKVINRTGKTYEVVLSNLLSLYFSTIPEMRGESNLLSKYLQEHAIINPGKQCTVTNWIWCV